MEHRKIIKQKLQKELKTKFSIVWSLEKEESPLTIKIINASNSDQLKSTMERWISTLSQAAKVKPIQSKRYIRINIRSNDGLTYVSVYGNGTIMFQGKGSEKWLMKNVDDILSKIKRDTPKGKVATKKPSSGNSVCTVCNNAHTNDMMKCHKCNAWIHTECDIDKILEDEAERRK